MSTATCSRCGRAANEDEYLDWEALDAAGDRMVCPDCVTDAEVQAMDEAEMELADTTPLGDPSDPRTDA